MEINHEIIEAIKDGDDNLKLKVISSLRAEFNTLQKRYDFIYSKKQFDQVISLIFDKCIIEYNGKMEFREFIIPACEELLNDIVEKKINDDKNCSIIKSYILKNTKTRNNTSSIISELKKVSNFVTKFKIEDLVTTASVILSYTNPINESIKKIVGDNKHFYIAQHPNIIEDDFIVCLLQVYCDLFDIEFDDNEAALAYDTYTSDDIRAYINEVCKYDLLTKDEEEKYSILASKGNIEARNILVERNLRLVVKIARGYTRSGTELLDLIQEGNIGLMRAAERFDASRGLKFSTYAVWWIKQGIGRAIENHSASIRIPSYYCQKIRTYARVREDLENETGRTVSIREIAKKMNLPLKEVEQIHLNSLDKVSLNALVDDDKDIEYGDFICDHSIDLEKQAMNEALCNVVHQIFEEVKLTDKEKDCLILKYGLFGNEPHTLDQIGKKYDVTRERIRQILLNTSRKIKFSKLNPELIQFLDNPDKANRSFMEYQKVHCGYFPDTSNQLKYVPNPIISDSKSIQELFKTAEFTKMTEILDVKTALIVALKTGILNDKYYSNKDISDFFHVNINDIDDITENGLSILKQNSKTLER